MFTSSPVHSSDSDYWKKLVVFDSDEDQCSNESEVFLPLSLGPLNQKSIINDSGLMCDEDLEIFESGEETDDCSTNHEIDFVSHALVKDTNKVLYEDLLTTEPSKSNNSSSDEKVRQLNNSHVRPKNEINKLSKKSNPKPKRPCFICGVHQSALSRHFLTHKSDPRICEAFKLSKIERRKAFDSFKKQGIHQFNLNEVQNSNPKFLRERAQRSKKNMQSEKFLNSNNLLMCLKCKGFFAKSYKTRHQIKCGEDSCQALIPSIAIGEIDKYNSLDNDFKLNILNVINNDEIGTLAKSDSIILMIGSRLYGKIKRRFDKKLEVEKSVRCSMRRLANIYNRFTIEKTEYPAKMLAIEQGNSGDMFLRGNIDYLKKAIENYTDKGEDKIKSGLKSGIYYLLKDSAEKCMGYYLKTNRDDLSKEVSNFLYIFGLMKDEIFSDAVYDLNKRRNEKHKKPAQLPMEEDIQTIRNHIVITMEKLTSEYEIIDRPSFIQLRDCACARLTIFNGRRGGEPARLTIKEWENALNNVWLDKQRIKNTLSESQLEDGMKITYQSGKGVNHSVPVLIPTDTIEAMKLLGSADIRTQAGVSANNIYIFPSTQSSLYHCSGWHSLKNIIKQLNLIDESKVTGTNNRHRLSTLVAGLGVSDAQMSLAYDHFGHSETINKTIYQAPAAHRQLLSTGKHLEAIDQNSLKQDLKKTINIDKKEQKNRLVEKQEKPIKLAKVFLTRSKAKLEASVGSSTPISLNKQEIANESLENHSSTEYESNSSESEFEFKTNVNQINKTKKSFVSGRKYNQWDNENESAFFQRFMQYVSSNIGYPSRQEMTEFGIKYGFGYGTVRNKITNERAKKMRIVSQRINDIQM
nr:uncharacterized protein LOC124811030 isoform X2 [Hydra vulgaris]